MGCWRRGRGLPPRSPAWGSSSRARDGPSTHRPRRIRSARPDVTRDRVIAADPCSPPTPVFSHPVLRVLRHRNYRLIWIGLMLSFIGSFMQSAALLWHVSLLVPPEMKGL